GDHAEAVPPCACGRGLPVIARILDRTRNMVRMPDGRLHWAAPERPRFAAIAPIIQIAQTAAGIEMKLVARRAPTAAEARGLRPPLGHPFAIAFSSHDAIAHAGAAAFHRRLFAPPPWAEPTVPGLCARAAHGARRPPALRWPETRIRRKSIRING